MKLKVKRRRKRIDDSWQHCCRWCHYYSKGECMHPNIFYYYDEGGVSADHDDWFKHASEEGKIQETILETLSEEKTTRAFFDDLVTLAIRCGMSANKVKQFKQGISDCFDIFVADSVPLIDGDLCTSLHGYELTWGNESDSVPSIANPEEMVCNYWE